jgi:hypothetical protein
MIEAPGVREKQCGGQGVLPIAIGNDRDYDTPKIRVYILFRHATNTLGVK